MNSLEKNVQILVDRAEIHDLILGYARNADTKNWEAFAQLFADDGYAQYPFGKVEKKDMARAAGAILQPFERTQHMFSNISITIDGDTARTNHYLQATHVPALAEQGAHADIGGWYDNTCRRTADGWKIVSVNLTFVWSGGIPFEAGDFAA